VGSGDGTSALESPQIDLSAFTLTVLAPSDQELAAHEGVLLDLDKASSGKTLWRHVA
jgi:DNA polymerase-3 subunit epsilon